MNLEKGSRGDGGESKVTKGLEVQLHLEGSKDDKSRKAAVAELKGILWEFFMEEPHIFTYNDDPDIEVSGPPFDREQIKRSLKAAKLYVGMRKKKDPQQVIPLKKPSATAITT